MKFVVFFGNICEKGLYMVRAKFDPHSENVDICYGK
jgi:hypothetical protein